MVSRVTWKRLTASVCVLYVAAVLPACVQRAGAPGGQDLVIAPDRPSPIVVVSPNAGEVEQAAASDLAKYVELMCGAKVATARTDAEIADALKMDQERVLLIVGQAALDAEPGLQKALDKVAKKDPVLRADAIVLLRQGNRVYVTGNNDQAHYYAVSRLLHLWGCRY